MKMILGFGRIQRCSHFARRLFAGALLGVGLTASAQNAVGTIAGSAGSPGYVNNATGTSARFRFTTPSHAAMDAAGNLYVVDVSNHAIRKIDGAGAVTTFAGAEPDGTGNGTAGNIDHATGTSARFQNPQGITIDGAGNLYVADTGNNAIRMISPGGAVTTVAGPGGTGALGASGFVNDTVRANVRFNTPLALFADQTGAAGVAVNLYVADAANNAIRRVVVATGETTTLTGGGPSAPGADNGTLVNARFTLPSGITGATDGTILYVADTNNHLVRKVDVTGNQVSTLAGSGSAGYAEGTGATAAFRSPRGVVLSGANVLVADTQNHVIRSIVAATGATSLLAGAAGSSGSTDGLATAARFASPSGLAVGAVTVVVDTANQTVRRISAASAPTFTSPPANATVNAGGNAVFSVTASGSPSTFTYQWQRSTDSGTTFTNLANGTGVSGATTNQLTLSSVTTAQSGHLFRVVVSNGVTPDATSPAATLTVTQPPAFTSAASRTFVAGQFNTFTVTASGSPAPTFTAGTGFPATFLTFNGTTGVMSGTPDTTNVGTYTFTITASNGVAPAATQSFTLTVSVNVPPSITTQPTNQTVAADKTGSTATASFTVAATGQPSTFTYQWQRQPAGTTSFANVANDSTYSGATTATLSLTNVTPAMNGDQFRAVVSNGVSPDATSNAATLTVQGVVAGITTPPSNASVALNGNATFTAVVAGNPAPGSGGGNTLKWQRAPAGSSTFADLSESSPYSGTATATLTVTGVTAAMTGDQFRVVATNIHGTATSAVATLTVTSTVPAFSAHPQNASVNIGTNATFTAAAFGDPAPTLRWQRQPAGVTGFSDINDGGAYGGAGTATLTITAATAAMNSDQFRLKATNSNGETVSNAATLSVVSAPPTFVTHPTTPTTATIGGNASFTAIASGSPAPTMRWQRKPAGSSTFVNLSDEGAYGGTSSATTVSTGVSSTLTVTGVTLAMHGDEFRVVATNASGDTASNVGRLDVDIGTVFGTFAGLAEASGSADGTGAAARFFTPSGVAVGRDGVVYVADAANHVIRRISPNGEVTTVAGRANQSGAVDGNATDARFNSPQGVAVDSAGTLYVADTGNHTIRVISTGDPRMVTTLAGSANSTGSTDGSGSAARFYQPIGIVVDVGSGALYVADSFNHSIRRVLTNGTVTIFAGGAASPGFVNETGTAARFSYPVGLAIDTSGNLYVADSLNFAIRRVTPLAVVTTVAGSGSSGVTDANGTSAQFSRPNGVAIDSDGVIYVADTGAHTIRRISTARDVTTIGGQAGAAGKDDGAGNSARFNQPFSIAIDSSKNLYVSDKGNHTIRRSGSRLAPAITTQPVGRLAAPGATVTFTVSASGTPTPTFQWTRALPDAPDTFSNLTADGTYSGVNTAQLTITNVTSAMSGQRFRVIVNNGVGVALTSDVATLTVGAPPVFTSANTATFRAGEAGSFTVAVTSTPAATFSLSNNPSWLSINSSTGVLSGTPPDTSGSPHTVTVTANNGLSSTQSITVTVLPALVAPTFSAHPASATVDQGGGVTFSASVTGTEPFSYQWRRNGVALPGATAASLTLQNVQPSAAGTYNVAVTNVVSTAVSNSATLTVNTAPTFTLQPGAQVATVGSAVTFMAPATGGNLSYQWRRNGVAIGGATSSTFTISNVGASDAANYDVLVSNALGTIQSSLAQLTIVTGPAAPLITSHPMARTALAGTSVTLAAAASGAPAPSYQWRRDGSALAGQTNATLTLSPVQASDAANYDVVASNASGSVTSNPASLRVIARSYAGTYFGSFGSLGEFAIYIREDNTGVFLGYLPGSTAPVLSLNFLVNDDGSFSFAQSAIAGTAAIAGEPARAAALAAVTVSGNISAGAITGSISGGATASLSGSRAPDTGSTQAYAGFHQAGAASSGASLFTIASPDGRAFVVVQSATNSDGGRGTLSSAGAVSVTTARSAITESLSDLGTLEGSTTGAIAASFSGGSDIAVARQRLLNISSRARVGAGAEVAIAGFVISGEQSKPVLIRAVGPTLTSFGVAGALAAPRLELFRGATSLAVNTGIGANRAAVDAAGVAAGAFALGAAGTDAAILTTLSPGAYTAVVSSNTTATGVALVEVYDLSAPTPGQKLLNISTRASAGAAENTLTAGFVVPAGAGKRVLIRGIGPGLARFSLTGVLANPVLTLLSGSTTLATNTSYVTSPDRAEIVTTSSAVGGFTLDSADSAMIVTLAPGNYTAQVVGSGGATGLALIEVYEVP